ncbi:hypothetical protein D3C76_1802050 [compost metagenome]
MHPRIDHFHCIDRIFATFTPDRLQWKTQPLLMAGHQMQTALDQLTSGQLLITIGPAHMPVRLRRDIGDTH